MESFGFLKDYLTLRLSLDVFIAVSMNIVSASSVYVFKVNTM